MIFFKTFSSAIILSTIIQINFSAALGRTLQSATLLPFTSEKATRFRQEFRVGNGREFNDTEIQTIQSIYVANTDSYAPEENEAENVTTNCTIFRQQIRSPEEENQNMNLDPSNDETNIENILHVDYIMKYSSKYYNVDNYTRLFQNWTNLNLELIQEQLNLLSINVTAVGKASRIVVSTPSPSKSPSPSTSPTSSENKNRMMDDVDNTVDSSTAPFTSPITPTVLSSKSVDSSSASFVSIITLQLKAVTGLCVVLSLF